MSGSGIVSGTGTMGSQPSSLALPPAGPLRACSRSSSDKGWKRSSMAVTSTIETEHVSDFPSRLGLAAALEVRDQRDDVAAACIMAREVGPLAAGQADPKRAEVTIDAPRIECDILATRPPTVGKEALEDGGQERQRRA